MTTDSAKSLNEDSAPGSEHVDKSDPTAAGPAPPASPGAARRLSRQADFNRLWLGQAVSAFGSQVTTLALPLTAVLYLHATAFQMGLMTAAREVAFLGPMLIFGVLVDRMRRKPLMIGTDLGLAGVIALVPVLAWTGTLAMPVLYLVALVAGCLASVFGLAYIAYLPSIVDSEVLLAGNSRLQATDSVSDVAGPGLAGVLIQLFSAPGALLADAASFLFSATMVASIRKHEPLPERDPEAADERWLGGVGRDIRSGLSFTFGHPVLRSLAVADAIFNFFAQLMLTLFVLYATRHSHLSASQIGVVYAAFGVGGVVAATTLGRTVARLGYGRLLLTGYLVGALAIAGTPFVSGSALVQTVLYALLFCAAGCGVIALNIAMMTLRQVATPTSAQGRVTAAFGFLIGALIPVSAILAGVLGERLGLRATLFVAAAGVPVSVLWLIFSPVRKLRTLEDLRMAVVAK
jgi:MFS family permease